ncbi:MAG: ABC transporter ATP-binding protein [Bacteroidota bacterium]
MHILELSDVLKAYESTVAVNQVSFNVPRGSIFGLLGPNGAGKTSLIRIITTITRADAGQIILDGEPLGAETPSQIGYMPEERGLYKKMKVGEQLMYLAQLKGLSNTEAKNSIMYWFDKFDIADWWPKKVEELSKGMQQKIQFISTVVHKPKLLILDEPFSGLDPINTNLIKDEIDELHRNGTSIIFSTHRMEQVEEICQRIVLINKGQNILEGDVDDIRQDFKDNLFEVNYTGDLPTGIQEKFSVVDEKDHSLTVQLEAGADSNILLKHLLENGVHVSSFNEILPSLNDIFIKQVSGQSDE